MQGLFGKTPKPDTSVADQRAAAEARAAAEKDALAKKQAEDESARKRGLRGVRSLFSEAGGFVGFGGKSTLGE